jgi:nucleotide-binding universal stress UspA family protein
MRPKIVVAYDFSETADAALAWAAQLQAATGGPRLEVINAVSLRPFPSPELLANPVPPTEDEIRRFKEMIHEAASRHRAEARAHVFVGPDEIESLILDAARELRADLIVMGTHGKTGLRRLLLGSVAEHIVRHADCPVVTVRG